jgi:nucleotide-binding universal stress UspA family protein
MARTSVRPLLIQRIVAGDSDHEVANEHLFERVLYATDFSENAERAFDQFRPLSGATQEATLLHVAPPDRRTEEESVDDATERLDALADELTGMGIETRTMVREGEVVGEILAAEAEVDPTVILLGSRGQGRIRRLLLGSTSEDVMARAESNVLLVPPGRLR